MPKDLGVWTAEDGALVLRLTDAVGVAEALVVVDGGMKVW